jgi:hypothetical protein
MLDAFISERDRMHLAFGLLNLQEGQALRRTGGTGFSSSLNVQALCPAYFSRIRRWGGVLSRSVMNFRAVLAQRCVKFVNVKRILLRGVVLRAPHGPVLNDYGRARDYTDGAGRRRGSIRR